VAVWRQLRREELWSAEEASPSRICCGAAVFPSASPSPFPPWTARVVLRQRCVFEAKVLLSPAARTENSLTWRGVARRAGAARRAERMRRRQGRAGATAR
jgi:hypothetical protein